MERDDGVKGLTLNKNTRMQKQLRTLSTSSDGRDIPVENLEEGISIIIPTYKGEAVIGTCLESLVVQTLPKQLFEVIIVVNGEQDGTAAIVNDYIAMYHLDNVIIHNMEVAGASLARNQGIALASREYIVFLDDDDYLSPNYLEQLYQYANEETVVIAQIVDVYSDGRKDRYNPINLQIKLPFEEKNLYRKLGKVLTINACKLLPTKYIKSIFYDPHLRSGEDVAYFTELFVRYNLQARVAPIRENVIYYRLLRNHSVSRQDMSFAFYVQERMEVIFRLNRIFLLADSEEKVKFIQQKICAQASFIKNYLQKNPSERERVICEIKKYDVFFFPYYLINEGMAETLVISYCFPPYVDTSGNVVAKRIRSKNEIVDVVYNDNKQRSAGSGSMIERKKDVSLYKIFEDLVEESIGIFSPFSFSDWSAIKQFCEDGLAKIKATKKKYRKVYSRAMWPASHFLAFEYKLYHPHAKWIAEFSDPIILDIHGKKRKGNVTEQEYIEKINNLLKKRGMPASRSKNLFFLCEYIAYAFADELVFTNHQQLKYMLDHFPIKEIRGIIESKAKVERQPTLPKEQYSMVSSAYELPASKVNLAYFGAFYGTRNLHVLFKAIENMKDSSKERLQLHIFTANPDDLKEEIKNKAYNPFITINDYVGFYEFLYLTTKFDCLIVNDTTTGLKDINPYLPSKVSDYMGSGSNILGLYEDGSVLSRYSLHYKANLANDEEVSTVLEKIVEDCARMKVSI